MWTRAHEIDRRMMAWSRRAASPTADRLLVGLTQAADYSRLWMAIAGVMAATGGKRGRRAAAGGTLSIAIAATFANGPAKLLVRRPRPSASSRASLIAMPATTSFPSGHSASAFAFATGACMELPRLAPLLVPLAGAVAYSRVYTGVHHPSDVLAGASIGMLAGTIGARLARRLPQPLRETRHSAAAPPRTACRAAQAGNPRG